MPTYGAIDKHSFPASRSELSKKSSKYLPIESSDTDKNKKKKVDIEDALTEAGFNWVQIKYLLVMSFIEVVMVADFEAVNFLGPLLLCRWDLSGFEEAMIPTSFFVAAIFGSLFWGKFADQFGRKTVLIVMSLLSAVSFLGASCSPGISVTLTSLFFAGFSKGAFFILFTYPTEIVGCSYRATACFFIFIAYAIGAIFGCALAMFTIPQHPEMWRVYLSILSIMHITGFFLLFLCAETPRFLLISGNPEKALSVIQCFNRLKNKDVVLKQSTVEDRGSWNDLVKNKECFKNLVILTLVCFSIGALMVGTVLLFLESLQNPGAHNNCLLVESFQYRKTCNELSSYDYVLQTASSTTAFVTAFLAKFMSDSFGRRNGLLIDGYFMVLFTSLFLFCKPKTYQTALAAGSRIITNTAQPVSTMYANELFPTTVRGTALGITMAGSSVGLAIAPFIAQYLTKANHPLAVLCFVGVSVLWVFCMHVIKRETKYESQVDSIDEPKKGG